MLQYKVVNMSLSIILSILIALVACITISTSNTLYSPASSPGTAYYLEAAREGTWPLCQYRFASVSSSCDSTVDLWKGAGLNQQWQLIPVGQSDIYYIKSVVCGRYLSYTSDCSSSLVDTWTDAGINQRFKLSRVGSNLFEYSLEAVGRGQCGTRFVSFPVGCTTSSPDKIDLWSAVGPDQTFRLHPAWSPAPVTHKVASSMVCPDPFVWQAKNTDVATASNAFFIQCTGDGIKLGKTSSLVPAEAYFEYLGNSLGGTPAAWAQDEFMGSRWAPENYEHPYSKNTNFLFFADSQSSDNGNHRVGYVVSSNGPVVNSWNEYSPNYLDLGMQSGGDIDINVFQDPDNGKTYLTWKTDDNNVGSSFTRLWLQEIAFNATSKSIAQLSSPQVIMDSTGLWWVDSWVADGSLVEAPELIKRNGYYYLFFASGKYCQDTYMEGVARSTNIAGPYEKMAVPLLSNGLTGVAMSPSSSSIGKLVGPGHASIVSWSKQGSTQHSIVYHASIGENCDRYSFVNNLFWGEDNWPYADLV